MALGLVLAGPVAADTGAEALVDRLDRSCGTPGFSLAQRAASFSDWTAATEGRVASILEPVTRARILRSVLLQQIEAGESEDMIERMVQRFAERAAQPLDGPRPLAVLVSETDASVSVIVDVTQNDFIDLTVCEIVLARPDPALLDDLVALFRLAPETNGNSIRSWSLGAGMAFEDSTVQLNRTLTLLLDDADNTDAAILSFSTQAHSR